jgi:hypothetical protein
MKFSSALAFHELQRWKDNVEAMALEMNGL